MEKTAAAEFLGVSTRTLERLSKAGRLTAGRARKKTRPVVVYDQQELERLKVELQAGRPAEVFRRLNTEKPRDAIGFRLDPFYVQRLTEAGEKEGLSASEFARRLVIRGVEDQAAGRMTEEISALRNALTEMFYLVLVTKLGASETEATEIVRSISPAVERA